jgi:exosortase
MSSSTAASPGSEYPATMASRPGGHYPLTALRRWVESLSGPDRGLWLAGLAGVGLLGVLFWPSLGNLVWTWSSDENYSHGFLVPLISLYFAGEAAKRGPVQRQGGFALGAALLVLGILGRMTTTVVPIGVVSDLAFLCALAGLVSALAGREALQRYGFSLFFLLFMIPLPIALYSAIASPLQLLVSRLAAVLLGLAGIPVLCQGNMMTLPGDVHLFVAEACSGMRQLTGFLALTTAVAWFSERPLWYRMVLVASAVPIALTANLLRVALTAWLAYAVNPALAGGHFHNFEGLLLMGVGLAMLAALCSALNLIFLERKVASTSSPLVARTLETAAP